MNNLAKIIDYINDNIIFGSKIKSSIIDTLLRKYPISKSEIDEVYLELESLNIIVEKSKYSLAKKLDKLFLMIGAKKELRQSNLEKWLVDESINQDTQKLIKTYLNNSGYSIINDVHKEINYDNFAFLDELDFDELNDILNDDKFIQEVSKLKNVADKSNNIEYLKKFHTNKENSREKIEALDSIIEANEKLVWKIVARYNQFATASFNDQDMFQSGMQGLIKAVERYDINKTNQFSTYAIWWIRQSITRAIDDFSTTIRIPVHMREKIIGYSKIDAQFWNENGRLATNSELANIIGTTINEIINVKNYRNIANLTSLDTLIGTEENSYLGDIIPDKKIQSPQDYVEDIMLKNELKAIFEDQLTKKEEKIIVLRFGLGDGTVMTLEEIGEIQGVTRERIRQIEVKALRKLKKPIIIEMLRDFYYD